ncbi:MAG: hypothetical protein JWN50_547 [Parcubacteria group bacterium]|nr:hypothetical protein [Parcubacteria group bacterium]
MFYRVLVYPDGVENRQSFYVLGDIEALNRDAVVTVLEAPLEGSDEPLVPDDYDYEILP